METFNKWLENVESMRAGTQSNLITFLKEKLNITDDDTILELDTNDIDEAVKADLLARGIISTSNPEIIERIKNGIKIKDLITLISSVE